MASSQPTGQGIVQALAVDPTDSRTVLAVYAALSGITAASGPTRHVFMTATNGASWVDISGVPGGGITNLPDLPLYSVVIDPRTMPHTIIVAGDGGVFKTQTSVWEKLGAGLPSVQVTWLALDTTVEPAVLRAATWGRSAFEIQLPRPPVPTCPDGLVNACGGCNVLLVTPNTYRKVGNTCGVYRCIGQTAVTCSSHQQCHEPLWGDVIDFCSR